MDRAISRVFLVGAVLMVALMVNLAWIQVFHARSLRDASQNHRLIAQQLRVKRGLILGFDGSTIAGDPSARAFTTAPTRRGRSPRRWWATTACATARRA